MSTQCWHCSIELSKGNAFTVKANLRHPSSHSVASALNMIYGCSIGTGDTVITDMMCRACHAKLSTLDKYFYAFLGTSDWKLKFQKQPSFLVTEVKPLLPSMGSVSENDKVILAGTSIVPFSPVPTTSRQETTISSSNVTPKRKVTSRQGMTIPSSNATPKRKASHSPFKSFKKNREHSSSKTTPLRRELHNSESTQKGRSTVLKYTCDKIKRQMSNFQKENCLEHQVLASDDLKLWPILTSELLLKAPFVLRVLEAIVGDTWRPSNDQGCITPSVGVAFAILLKQRKTLCSRFQKWVSLVLSDTMASKEVGCTVICFIEQSC